MFKIGKINEFTISVMNDSRAVLYRSPTEYAWDCLRHLATKSKIKNKTFDSKVGNQIFIETHAFYILSLSFFAVSKTNLSNIK